MCALGALRTLNTLNTLRTLRALNTLRALGASVALRALGALRTLNTLRTLRALHTLGAGVALCADLYQSALSHPGIVEFPFEHARIVLAQGMWLRRIRRYTEARAVLESAAEAFDRLGARPWAKRARAELRASGASVKQSLGETVPLSAQEYRVAQLAAAGRTSKEIAKIVNLSPRTVDSHLAKAFRKLGIARRAGLADALRRYDSETGMTSVATGAI